MKRVVLVGMWEYPVLSESDASWKTTTIFLLVLFTTLLILAMIFMQANGMNLVRFDFLKMG